MSPSQQSFYDFARDLREILPLTEEQSVRLAEVLDDRVKEVADERARDALDREFNRGDYRY